MNVKNLQMAGLEARASLRADVLEVQLFGMAEARCATSFGAFIDSVHLEAGRLHANEVLVDLTQLEFFSSACFNKLVGWLICLQGDTRGSYRVRFRASSARTWQARSLQALSCFSVDFGIVEV